MKIVLVFLLGVVFAYSSVKINSASIEEFKSLNGIGQKKASKIVTYRKMNGCFKSIAALEQVKGISSKTIMKNKNALILDKCPNKSKK